MTFLQNLGYIFEPIRTEYEDQSQPDDFEEAMKEAWVDMDGQRRDYGEADDWGVLNIHFCEGFTEDPGVSAAMNLISHSHAYSLYPRATFEDRLTLGVVCEDTNPISWLEHQDIQDVIESDWTRASSPNSMEAFYVDLPRRLGDPISWTMKLEGVPAAYAKDEDLFPYRVLESNSWCLSERRVLDPNDESRLQRSCEEHGSDFEEALE
ncbi:hypothetical protein MPER_04871 [Moniliophthora perniciosa FA553]|nr:hypothetical protein MPER_04871 [Moniliophthora perniciosa FA553]